jgi:2-polyprenyl-6-methoxyphenol hydroxylase-like FAD-dependent oxidoreductase
LTRSAVVLGGGIAGLSAALALCRAGYRVGVHEQADAIEPMGAAISLWPNAVAALRDLGALDVIAVEAAPITTMLLATRDGKPLLGPWPVGQARHGEAAYLPTRALVQRALMAALSGTPLHLGRHVTAVRDTGSETVVTFVDGEVIAADLAVVADGIRSETATAVIGNPPRPCGYGGVLALSDPVHGPTLDGLAAEYWGEGDRFGVFEIGGGRRYWFYMHRQPAPAADRDALLALADGWPASVAAAIRATPAERLIPVSIAARSVPRRLGAGSIVCVGDAAHAMEPNLGQGACQALEDAVALGRLAERVPPQEIAARLTRARRSRVAFMMRRAAEGGWAAHGGPATRAFWRTLFRLTPSALNARLVDGLYRMPNY